jgi:hypothetical protein
MSSSGYKLMGGTFTAFNLLAVHKDEPVTTCRGWATKRSISEFNLLVHLPGDVLH